MSVLPISSLGWSLWLDHPSRIHWDPRFYQWYHGAVGMFERDTPSEKIIVNVPPEQRSSSDLSTRPFPPLPSCEDVNVLAHLTECSRGQTIPLSIVPMSSQAVSFRTHHHRRLRSRWTTERTHSRPCGARYFCGRCGWVIFLSLSLCPRRFLFLLDPWVKTGWEI